MGVVFRQSIKTTIVIFVGAILGAIIIWLSTQNLSKQNLGFMRQLTSYAVIGTQLLLLGTQNTISVYIHKYATSKSKRGVLLAGSLLLPIIIVPFCSIFYFLFKNNIIHFLFKAQDVVLVGKYFMWLPIFSFLMMYQVILEQYLVSQVIVALSAFIREVLLRLCNIITILLFGFGYITFSVFIAANVLVYIIPIIIYFILSIRTKSFSLSFNYKSFTSAEIKEVIEFTFYHSLLSLSITLMGSLDTIMLGKLDRYGLVSVGIYVNAIFFISILQMPYKAMYSASFPIIASAFKDNNILKVRDLFKRSSLNILIGATLMAIIIICNIDNAILLLPKGYEVIKPLVIILILGSFTDMATGMNSQILSISKYYKYNFYGSIILVMLMIILNVLLIPKIGIYGAAWSTTIGLMIFNINKCYYVWRKLNLQPFSTATILILLSGIPAFCIGYFLPTFFINIKNVYAHSFFDTMLRCSLVSIIYFLMLLWLKPSPDLTEYFNSIFKNKKLF